MRFDFGALPWQMLGSRPVMITLTYPGDWQRWVPDAREFVRQREAFKERWRRRYGSPIGVWVTEFQKRGAPHLHMYVGLPDVVSDAEYRGLQERTMRRRRAEHDVGRFEARRRERAPSGDFAMWLRTAWWEVVGSGLRAHHGRGVDIAAAFFSERAAAEANRVRVAEYFWRESGKWAQKLPPAGFGPLKFYGRWGQKEGFNPVVSVSELDERVGLELRRMMRRMMLGKMRENARRYGRVIPRAAGRSRGRDGLTVYEVAEARTVAQALVECAERNAIDKAIAGANGETIRALSPRAVARQERRAAAVADSLATSPLGQDRRNAAGRAYSEMVPAFDLAARWPERDIEGRVERGEGEIERWSETNDPTVAEELRIEESLAEYEDAIAATEAAIDDWIDSERTRQALAAFRRKERLARRRSRRSGDGGRSGRP